MDIDTSNVFDRGRMVYLDGDIESTQQSTRQELRSLALTLREQGSNQPIILVICSPGGSASGAMALADEILHLRMNGQRVDGLVQGEAMSAAAIALQACDHRLIGANAMLMLHGSAGGAYGSEEDHKASAEYTRRLHDRIAYLIGSRTAPLGGKKIAAWRDVLRTTTDRYYTAHEALQAGLVDEIVGA